MKTLNIDLETFSCEDLKSSGVYRYSDSSSFEILLFAYSVDGGEVCQVDLACGETIPKDVIEAIRNPDVIKIAFNAQFERVCLSRYLNKYLDPKSWRCTMVHALYLGLPGSLAMVGEVLNIDKKKMEEGKNLIKMFSTPRKPTKANPATRIYPEDDMTSWETYKAYNRRDVETEMEIGKRLSKFPVPSNTWNEYELDQRINDYGICIDMALVGAAIECDNQSRERYLKRAQELTGLDNPNSPTQLKEYFNRNGYEVDSLAKDNVTKLLETATGDAKEVLELRQLLSKSSVKKYAAMENCICSDNRAHGLLQFYGANRTGRWAGRLIQVQNLPQNHIEDLDIVRNLVRNKLFEATEILYDSIPDVLSQLVRTAFVPEKDCKFIVADFSAIEARVIAWLAGESWRQKVFSENGDIYCESASKMFGVEVKKHGPNAHLRQKGKIAELALGYGGGEGAMVAMGALNMGIEEGEIKEIVNSWRKSNPAIVKLWWDVHKCVVGAIKQKRRQIYKCLSFEYESGILFITLPSGRKLSYAKPSIYKNEYDRDEVSYMGIDASKHWSRIGSYGPKFVENIVQAISRDILAEAMLRLDENGIKIVMHIHDESVCEVPYATKVEDICTMMATTPTWANGLILNAAGYECEFYKKD